MTPPAIDIIDTGLFRSTLPGVVFLLDAQSIRFFVWEICARSVEFVYLSDALRVLLLELQEELLDHRRDGELGGGVGAGGVVEQAHDGGGRHEPRLRAARQRRRLRQPSSRTRDSKAKMEHSDTF